MKKIWYKQEAKAWNDALPLGNGRIGAMMFSGSVMDRIQINEDTLWSGQPEVESDRKFHSKETLEEIRQLITERAYDKAEAMMSDSMFGVHSQAFLTAGNVFVELNDTQGYEKDYTRALNLETAILSSEYKMGQDTFQKEAFISYPDQVLVYKVRNLIGKSCFTIHTTCDLKHSISTEKSTIFVEGNCPTNVSMYSRTVKYDENKESIRFSTQIKAVSDGTVLCTGSGIRIDEASELTVYISIGTSFNGYNKMPVSEGLDCNKICSDNLNNALAFSYDELKKRHIDDYKALFDRVSIKLGEYIEKPTDERILNYKNDTDLVGLLFDFGRYLMISSSRKGTQAANLQGIWNNMVLSPWHSNYTMNINTEMNYWATEVCNLGECHYPLFELLKDLSERGNCFGFKGWASWHNSDLWRFNYGATKDVLWGYCLMCGFWSCRHIWEHYLYTRDKDFLKQYFDVLKGAVDFLKDWMIVDKDGYYTTSPSTSPENTFMYNGVRIAAATGTAIDLTILKELFTYMAKASEILGYDASEYEHIASKTKPLSIGKDGRLMEWNEEFEEVEHGHRHLSHLYGIYPSNIIDKDSKYYKAARNSLEYRIKHGGGSTGWSNAWIANLYARFKEGQMVQKYIDNMFEKSIYFNMFDAHPPFQIDGNFGICAAIAESMLQSQVLIDDLYAMEIFPAKPDKWNNGSVNGLRARGGYTVNILWNKKKTYVEIIPDNNGIIILLNNNISKITENDETLEFITSEKCTSFDALKNKKYKIELFYN